MWTFIDAVYDDSKTVSGILYLVGAVLGIVSFALAISDPTKLYLSAFFLTAALVLKMPYLYPKAPLSFTFVVIWAVGWASVGGIRLKDET